MSYRIIIVVAAHSGINIVHQNSAAGKASQHKQRKYDWTKSSERPLDQGRSAPDAATHEPGRIHDGLHGKMRKCDINFYEEFMNVPAP